MTDYNLKYPDDSQLIPIDNSKEIEELTNNHKRHQQNQEIWQTKYDAYQRELGTLDKYRQEVEDKFKLTVASLTSKAHRVEISNHFSGKSNPAKAATMAERLMSAISTIHPPAAYVLHQLHTADQK